MPANAVEASPAHSTADFKSLEEKVLRTIELLKSAREAKAAAERLGKPASRPPDTTAIGALLNHITGGHIEAIDAGPRSFQPMNVNFGLFPPIEGPKANKEGKRLRGPEKGVARKQALSARARIDLDTWLAGTV